MGASRHFPRAQLSGYVASLTAIPPTILLERQNVHGRQVRVSDPRKLAGNGAKADFCFLADRGIVGNGHMLMLEDNSDAVAGVILDWLEGAGGGASAAMGSGERAQGACAASPRNK